jgi:hypothetical protein
MLARPLQRPGSVTHWCQERLRSRHEIQVRSKIDHEQSIIIRRSHVPEYKGLRTQRGTIQRSSILPRQDGIIATQTQ